MLEEVLPDRRQVGLPRRGQALAPAGGERGVGPARVVRAGHPLDQAVALQAVDQTRETASAEVHRGGELTHAHLASVGVV